MNNITEEEQIEICGKVIDSINIKESFEDFIINNPSQTNNLINTVALLPESKMEVPEDVSESVKKLITKHGNNMLKIYELYTYKMKSLNDFVMERGEAPKREVNPDKVYQVVDSDGMILNVFNTEEEAEASKKELEVKGIKLDIKPCDRSEVEAK